MHGDDHALDGGSSRRFSPRTSTGRCEAVSSAVAGGDRRAPRRRGARRSPGRRGGDRWGWSRSVKERPITSSGDPGEREARGVRDPGDAALGVEHRHRIVAWLISASRRLELRASDSARACSRAGAGGSAKRPSADEPEPGRAAQQRQGRGDACPRLPTRSARATGRPRTPRRGLQRLELGADLLGVDADGAATSPASMRLRNLDSGRDDEKSCGAQLLDVSAVRQPREGAEHHLVVAARRVDALAQHGDVVPSSNTPQDRRAPRRSRR